MYISIVATVSWYCSTIAARWQGTATAFYVSQRDVIAALYREQIAACPRDTVAMSHCSANCIGTIGKEIVCTNCSSLVNQQPVSPISPLTNRINKMEVFSRQFWNTETIQLCMYYTYIIYAYMYNCTSTYKYTYLLHMYHMLHLTTVNLLYNYETTRVAQTTRAAYGAVSSSIRTLHERGVTLARHTHYANNVIFPNNYNRTQLTI